MTRTDPEIERLREELARLDLSVVASVNRRLELVEELKRVKEERALAFFDPDREEWMHGYLSERNEGPLTGEGLRELYSELLALTKRELGRRAS
jgi:chorismate mutase